MNVLPSAFFGLVIVINVYECYSKFFQKNVARGTDYNSLSSPRRNTANDTKRSRKPTIAFLAHVQVEGLKGLWTG
jgi:hypothetical protein